MTPDQAEAARILLANSDWTIIKVLDVLGLNGRDDRPKAEVIKLRPDKPRRPKPPKVTVDEAVAAYEAGTPVSQIGLAPKPLYDALHRRGIRLRSQAPPDD